MDKFYIEFAKESPQKCRYCKCLDHGDHRCDVAPIADVSLAEFGEWCEERQYLVKIERAALGWWTLVIHRPECSYAIFDASDMLLDRLLDRAMKMCPAKGENRALLRG